MAGRGVQIFFELEVEEASDVESCVEDVEADEAERNGEDECIDRNRDCGYQKAWKAAFQKVRDMHRRRLAFRRKVQNLAPKPCKGVHGGA